ncbi:MAG TPA: hypothetical protein VFN71_02935 [Methylomirabilota bacterium]|nr:hypothetical protein [Methylomirabilota bacterium]
MAALKAFLERQRWFASKARGIGAVGVEDWATLRPDPPLLLVLVRADADRYYLPVALGPPPAADRTIGQIDTRALYDAHWDPDFGRELLGAIVSRRVLPAARGAFRCAPMEPWGGPAADELETLAIAPHGGEQSNTSIVFGQRLILKSIRRPTADISPDFEILHFLAGRTGFTHVPRLAGWVEYAADAGETSTVGLLEHFVVNEGDGWTHTLARLHRECDSLQGALGALPPEAVRRPAAVPADLLAEAHELGAVTGSLHAALASDPSVPAFCPEAITHEDAARWGRGIARDLEQVLAEVGAPGRLPEPARAAIGALLGARARIERAVEDLLVLADGRTHKIRCHGDYHLGQVLRTAESFVVIDFEGEPARSVEERRAKHSPLRDVAGMLRSFDYAAHATLFARPPAARERLRPWLEEWERLASRAFTDGYVTAAGKSPVRLLPPFAEGLRRACAAFELEKACYELRYEFNHRPDWISIPLAGISRILDASHGDH